MHAIQAADNDPRFVRAAVEAERAQLWTFRPHTREAARRDLLRRILADDEQYGSESEY